MLEDVENISPSEVLGFMEEVTTGQKVARDVPVVRAKGGLCYAYCSLENRQKKDDWKADGYRWRHTGKAKITIANLVIRKTYFNAYSSPKVHTSNFRRIAHECDEYPHIVIVHYKGDSLIAGSFPHGNRRCDSKPFIRTCPSILLACKDAKGEPSAIYRKMVKSIKQEREQETEAQLSLPRDILQVANVKKYMRKKQREISNAIHELRNEVDNEIFITDIFCEHENLCTIMYQEERCNKVNSLLSKLPLAECMTLTCGAFSQYEDFLINALLCRHKDSSVIELMFFIHHSKAEFRLKDLWRIASEKIPKLTQFENVVLEKNDNHSGFAERKLDCAPFFSIIEKLKLWNSDRGNTIDRLQCTAKHLHSLALHYSATARNSDFKIDGREKYQVSRKFTGLFDLMQDDVALNCTPTSNETTKFVHDTFSRNHNLSKISNNPVELARNIIDQNGVEFTSDSGTFLITDEFCVRAVKLFPTETCHCNFPSPCHHIIAAKYSIGIPYPKIVFEKRKSHKRKIVPDDSGPNKQIIIEIVASENVIETDDNIQDDNLS